MDGYHPDTYGRSFADVYDEWYGDVSDVDSTVAGVVDLAGSGPVLELGVGTGRLALPLAVEGLAVTGVDASAEMLARLTAKPGADAIEVVTADMAALPTRAGHYSLVFAAFNTFFNLSDDAAQRRCLAGVAATLRAGGRFAVEGFVPPTDGMPDGGVSVRDVTVDEAVLTVTRHDENAQTIRGQHVHISAAGVRMRPWQLHYLAVDQLDAMAADAGLSLERRSADWAGALFDADESDAHVSVYRLPDR